MRCILDELALRAAHRGVLRDVRDHERPRLPVGRGQALNRVGPVAEADDAASDDRHSAKERLRDLAKQVPRPRVADRIAEAYAPVR